VIVEVTSDSTEEYDRGDKLAGYQSIPTLAAIVLLSHRERLVEVFERPPNATWRRIEARRKGNVTIESLGCVLVTDELYETAGVSE
jgi:Uma2 family endonuclease